MSSRAPGLFLLGISLPALALFALFSLWPIARVFLMALQRWNGYDSRGFTGLGNVQSLLTDPLFAASLRHTLLWVAAAAVLGTLLSLALALLIGAARGRAFALALLFVPVLLPPAVVAAIWTLVYSPLSGGLNTLLRTLHLGALQGDWLGDPHLALPSLFTAWLWSELGLSTLVVWGGLQDIGHEYVEIALLEGADWGWRFRHITLPALRPHLLLAALIAAALALQVFDLVFVTTGGGPGNAAMLLSVDLYDRAFGGHIGQGAAEGALEVIAGLALAAVPLLLLRGQGRFATGEGLSPHRGHPAATALLLLLLLLVALPLLWLLPAAVEPGRAFTLGIGGATLDPRTWDGGNIAAAWNAGMSGAIARSLILALLCPALALLLAVPAAYALSHPLPAALRLTALALLLAALFAPATATIIPLFTLLQSLDLLDTLWGVILPEAARALPFSILLLWAFLITLPPEPMEAAQIDGAGPGQTLLYISLPLLRPALAVVAVWGFITSWNEYLLPTVVSQDGSLQTVPTLLASFIGRYDTAFGQLAVGAILAVLPPLLLFLLVRAPAARALRRAGRTA